MTCTLTTSPMRPAAAAPASVAAFTAATSPVTNAVTKPLPTLSQPRNCDVRGLHHRVGRFDQGDEALGLDHAERFHLLCHR